MRNINRKNKLLAARTTAGAADPISAACRARALIAILALASAGLASCRTVDYAYRHDVSGRVTDESGRPAAGVRVYRIGENDDALLPGSLNPQLYKRTTDPDGRFAFTYSGLGRKPVASLPWRLIALSPDFRPKTFDFQVAWQPFTDKNTQNYGYVKHDVQLVLARAPLRFSFSSGGAHHFEGHGAWIVQLSANGAFSIAHDVRGVVKNYGSFSLAPEEHQRLWDLVFESGLTSINPAPRQGVPDEVMLSFALHQDQKSRSVNIWANDAAQIAELKALTDYIALLIKKHTGTAGFVM